MLPSTRIYVSGTKHHDSCPGHWFFVVEREDAPWIFSQQYRTGAAAVGQLNAVPMDIYLPGPGKLDPGSYTARVSVEYHCLIPFRHWASFELAVPEHLPEPEKRP